MKSAWWGQLYPEKWTRATCTGAERREKRREKRKDMKSDTQPMAARKEVHHDNNRCKDL
jgi:hypothetical protein